MLAGILCLLGVFSLWVTSTIQLVCAVCLRSQIRRLKKTASILILPIRVEQVMGEEVGVSFGQVYGVII